MRKIEVMVLFNLPGLEEGRSVVYSRSGVEALLKLARLEGCEHRISASPHGHFVNQAGSGRRD